MISMDQSKPLRLGAPIPFCKDSLERLYAVYNRREYIHPDPLEFVHQYHDPLDREVVGMVASSLAYGRVHQILKSVSDVLCRMGESPTKFILGSSFGRVQTVVKDFRHRFTDGDQLAALLYGIKRAIKRYGSLQSCFIANCKHNHDNILPALRAFVHELGAEAPGEMKMLLPSPRKGSACKRLNLFLRWMVRSDDVDPGGWSGVGPHRLIVPLDTHMHRIALDAGLTSRKQADMRTAMEVTQAFRAIAPEDPVRYDFALTRLGIRDIKT
jgi:uncharacterized protein (TIGR02757 family)